MFDKLFQITLSLFLLLHLGCASLNRTAPIDGVPIPSERMAEIRSLGENAQNLTAQRQEKYALSLEKTIRQQTDPLIRREAVLAIANFPGETTERALRFAMEDSDKDIRLAVCTAWQTYNREQSVPALLEMLTKETDLDIRLEVIDILGKMGDKRAVTAMAEPLGSSDPALQHYSMAALKKMTGYECDDRKLWLAYCKGEIENPEEHLAWNQK
ncbi:MAG: HEAT repeat domain-containing protein [Planctomycetia bacterium]|nr:HEAT repeat domain-containing protein [Planctomycetia bacterium]